MTHYEEENRIRFYRNEVKDGIRALRHAGERLVVVTGALTLGVQDPDDHTIAAGEVAEDLLNAVNSGQRELDDLLERYVRDLEVLRDWDA